MTKIALSFAFLSLFVLSTISTASGEAIDLNGDGVFDIDDIVILTSLKGKTSADPGFDAAADVNNDQVIDFNDVIIVSQSFADPVGGGGLNFRDFYPLHVGDFWFFRSDDFPNNLDDFTRTVTEELQPSGNFKVHTTSMSDPQNEFIEVVTPSGDLQIAEFTIVNPIVEGILTIPPQTITFSTPLTIVASSIEAGEAATTTATAQVDVTVFGMPRTEQGTIEMVSVVSSIADSVVLDATPLPVTITDTVTISYQSDVTVSGFTLFLPPLSAIVTFGRDIGLIRLQEFTDPNTPGEIFLLRNGQVNGVVVP